MAQAVNIILADAQATPVNHTFIPIGPQKDGFFAWETANATSALGNFRIEVRARRTGTPGGNAGQRLWRADVRVKTPTLETLSTNDAGMVPPPRQAYVLASEHSFVINERANLVERRTARKFGFNILDVAQVKSLIEDSIPIW